MPCDAKDVLCCAKVLSVRMPADVAAGPASAWPVARLEPLRRRRSLPPMPSSPSIASFSCRPVELFSPRTRECLLLADADDPAATIHIMEAVRGCGPPLRR